MRIDFRQGIITYPSSGQNQTFLSYSGGYVSFNSANGRTDVAFAHLTENYLLSESTDVANAWGPLSPGVDYWLYWDIDLRTAVRTFGFTTLQPVTTSVQPSIVEGQHWFNSSTTTMYVATSGAYRPVARVFAAKVRDGVFTPLGIGVYNKPFAGTQVGLTTQGARTGRILIDNSGLPIRRVDGRFFTTETEFFVDGSPVNVTTLEGAVVQATAQSVLPKFHVVKFTEFGKIASATYDDIQTSTIALLNEDLTINQVGAVIVQGYVSNPDWNWPALSNLWVGETGELVATDPHESDPISYPIARPPVARVVSPTSIIFDQGLGGIGPRGATGTSAVLATDLVHGNVRLSVEAAVELDPIAVGDNDPRLADARAPLAHTQAATTIIPTAYGSLTGANLQLTLQQIEDGKLPYSGGVLTGALTLSGAPTSDLHAATKAYVDAATPDLSSRVAKSGDTMTGYLTLSGAPTLDLHAATKAYVDASASQGTSNQISQLDSVLAITNTGAGDEQLLLTFGGIQTALMTPGVVNLQGPPILNEWAQFLYTNPTFKRQPSGAVDTQGNLITVDENGEEGVYVYKINPSGGVVWSVQATSFYPTYYGKGGIAIDSGDNAYVSFSYSGVVGFHVMRISQSGEVLWSTSLTDGTAGQVVAASLSVDVDDNCIVSGFETLEGTTTCYIAKINSLGSILWSKTMPVPLDNEFSYEVVTSGNNIYLTSLYGAGADPSIGVQMLDGSGNVAWQQRYLVLPATSWTESTGSTIANGYLYFGVMEYDGDGFGTNFLYKVNAASGAVVWAKQVTTSKGILYSPAVDPVSSVSYWKASPPDVLYRPEASIISVSETGDVINGYTIGQQVAGLDDVWIGWSRSLLFDNGWLWLVLPADVASGAVLNSVVFTARVSTTSFMAGQVSIDPPYIIGEAIVDTTSVTPVVTSSSFVWSSVTRAQGAASITTVPVVPSATIEYMYVPSETSVDLVVSRSTVELGRDPVSDMDAATKRYVDASIANIQTPLPPITGYKEGPIAETPDNFVASGFMQYDLLAKISVTEHTNSPIFRVSTPLPYSPLAVPNAVGYTLEMDGVQLGFSQRVGWVTFTEGGEFLGIPFVNPYADVVINNDIGAGIPLGIHDGNNDYNMINIYYPVSTPPAYIRYFSDDVVHITPASLTGLAATTYSLTFGLLDPSFGVISSFAVDIDGAVATTMGSLITEINNAVAAFHGGNEVIRCAWSFGNSIVFVLGNSTYAQDASYISVTSTLFDDISVYYDYSVWGGDDIVPATGPQPIDPYASNTNASLFGLRWHIPIVGATGLQMPGLG